MRENRTLKYSKVFIVNPGTPSEATYTNLSEIKTGRSGPELYAVQSEKDAHGGNMSIIDATGKIITREKYAAIGATLRHKGGTFTIPVYDKDGKINLIDKTGQKYFKDWYDGINYCPPSLEHLCILEKDGRYGLANLRTREILAAPRWLELSHIFGSMLFKIVDKKTPEYYRWGIMNAMGKVIYAPEFTDYFLPYLDWDIFNKVTYEMPAYDGLKKVKILDEYGCEVYHEYCIWCKRYREAENDSSERAFLFAKKYGYYGDALTKKIVIFYSSSTGPSFRAIVPKNNRF